MAAVPEGPAGGGGDRQRLPGGDAGGDAEDVGGEHELEGEGTEPAAGAGQTSHRAASLPLLQGFRGVTQSQQQIVNHLEQR